MFAQLTSDHFLVDNSTIELLTTCPWLAYAKVIRRRTLAVDQPALRFGGHLHAALAFKYRRMAHGKKVDNDTFNRILSKRFEMSPCFNEEWRDVNMAQQVLEEYNNHYASEQLHIAELKGFPLVEKPFAVYAGTIGKRKIIYIGRIDLALYEGPHLYVMDHKTTSMLGDTYWRDVAVSEQQRGYCWALRETFQQEPLGYKMNVLACRKPTKTGKGVEFVRQTYFTQNPPGQLDRWHSNMLHQVEMFLWHVDRNVFPRHHKHCVGKYGSCAMYSVCEIPDPQSQEDALMSGLYKDNDWSPLFKV